MTHSAPSRPRRLAGLLASLTAGPLRRVVPALLAILVAGGCRSADDQAQPVATVSVSPASPQVKPGTLTALTYRFVVEADAPAFTEDYSVFLHASAGGAHLWADDHQPPRPVREWTPGTVVEYRQEMLVPPGVPPGPVVLNAGVYAPASGNRLPLGGQADGERSYRVGTLEVLAADPPPLYVSGWNNLEAGSEGIQWRWTTGRAAAALRNPRSDSTLVVVMDQPVPLPPRQVIVEVADVAVDRFAVPAGQRVVRRIPLSAAALGEHGLTRVTVAVDAPFVPRDVPALNNPDARLLGVRVFSVYFDRP